MVLKEAEAEDSMEAIREVSKLKELYQSFQGLRTKKKGKNSKRKQIALIPYEI